MLCSDANLLLLYCSPQDAGSDCVEIGVSTFQVDATPPIGSPLCLGYVTPVKKIVDPLSVRGLVIITEGPPIVLCAVDWVEIANGGYDCWRRALSDAVGTTPDRVCVHTIHPHDAPGHNFSEEELSYGGEISTSVQDRSFVESVVERVAESAKRSLGHIVKVTHVGFGKAEVQKVASNRRLLDEQGKVKHVRYSSCSDESLRELPEGVIDPYLRNVSLWNGEVPIVSITYYATHPQSFYGKGAVSPDFVGMARAMRDATLPEVFHVHFNGAGGNIAAGKYNDGSPINRLILAQRLLKGMESAWNNTIVSPIRSIEWKVRSSALPIRDSIKELGKEGLISIVKDEKVPRPERIHALHSLVWLQRCSAGYEVDITCLKLNEIYILHMPGELFVEYQLLSQQLRPNSAVCVAAYGDCGPGYIGTEVSYQQGGYETSVVSRVAPNVEKVINDAMKELLT